MNLRSRVLSVVAAGGLAAVGLAATPVTHVHAGSGVSGACSDGVGNDDVPILSNPITLGLDVGSPALGAIGHSGYGGGTTDVFLCYSTTPNGFTGAEVTGGAVGVVLASNGTATAGCSPDNNPQGVAISCAAGVFPTYSITPGPPGSLGDTITVNIPFGVCVPYPNCTNENPGVAPTGLLVGQLVPVAEPGIGVGYQLNGLLIYVDGILLVSAPVSQTGAFVNPFGAIAESLNFSQGGPCIVGVCVPNGYVETTGSSVAGIQIPGVGSFAVPVPRECLYTNPSGQCP